MTRVRWGSGTLLWTLGMHSLVACGGNSSDGGQGGPSSAGESFAAAGNAGRDAGAAGTSGSAGMVGSSGNAGANSGGGASGTAGATCTDLVNGAPALEETYVAGPAPAPTGGVVHDGTYFETAFVNYGAAPVTPAPTHRFTARITNSSFFEAVYSDTNVSNNAEQRIAFRFETSGTQFQAMRTCLNGVVGFQGYDATPTTLTLHLPPQRNGGGVTYTLTKQ